MTDEAGRARRRPREPTISHERRIILLALFAGGAGVVVSMVVLWTGDYTTKVQWTLSALILCTWLGFAFAARERVVIEPLDVLPAIRTAHVVT